MKAIAAMSQNRVIGAGDSIPWHIPAELKFFKATTLGSAILMGRKTFESIGKPLPGRENIVLSRQKLTIPGVTVINDISEINTDKEIFLIGGAQLYTLFLEKCSELFLTVVHRNVEGDVFFPDFENIFYLSETIQKGDEFSSYNYKKSA